MIHPARALPFDELLAGLEAARRAGFVYRQFDGATGLSLYCYTKRCVYEDAWDGFTTIARGLVLHEESKALVATPFPKFFNAGEKRGMAPNLPFEAFEKLDGSLVIAFHFKGEWRTATKGDFHSSQALWAGQRLEALNRAPLEAGTTYLFEAIYPENRIVVRYSGAALVLLGAYDPAGRELDSDRIGALAGAMGARAARARPFASIAEMQARADLLTRDEEGFVARFTDGTRLKVKGGEYRRIHAIISRCTPLAMWEAMAAQSDMTAIRRDLPEELWRDFDDIVRLLAEKLVRIEAAAAAAAAETAQLSDKELGLGLGDVPPELKPLVFTLRKQGAFDARSREILFRMIRPTGNVLEGYRPSIAMLRVAEEMT